MYNSYELWCSVINTRCIWTRNSIIWPGKCNGMTPVLLQIYSQKKFLMIAVTVFPISQSINRLLTVDKTQRVLKWKCTISKTGPPRLIWRITSSIHNIYPLFLLERDLIHLSTDKYTRGQSNLTKSASQGAHSPVRGYPRGSKVVPLNSWGRVSY